MIKLTQRLSIALLVAGLIACGGGGRGSSSPPPSLPSPSLPSPSLTPFTIGDAALGHISSVNDIDRWSISLNKKGALLVYTTAAGSQIDTRGGILNLNGEVIAENDDADDSLHFRLCLVLEPNDYIIQVGAFQAGSYNIHAEFDETRTSGYCGIDDFREWSIDDYNIRDLHAMNIIGQGINISVVDNGLEIGHEDLQENVLLGMSHNYLLNRLSTDDPTPIASNNAHGTSAAGIIAARSGNNIGLTGVAGRASIYGYNLLVDFTEENQLDAMTRHHEVTDISSNSWGSPDRGRFSPAESLWERGIITGITNGSNGKGISYIWSAGNGKRIHDNSNYDGYANFYGIISVCAVGENRIVTDYSEPGANLWLCAPSASAMSGVTTTDLTGPRGSNQGVHDLDYSNINYRRNFGGTSAATPFVSGVVALMRQVTPTLTWRDVKLILAESSDMPAIGDIITGAGVYSNSIAGGERNYKFHHDYGFGIVNPTRAVEVAKQWQSVLVPLKEYQSDKQDINLPIPDKGDGSINSNISISNSDINFIEYVEIGVSINHTYAGDLDISLTSPSGQVSNLAHRRACAPPGSGCGDLLNDFRFGSSLHLGESVNGTWTMQITDDAPEDLGMLLEWRLRFYGH